MKKFYFILFSIILVSIIFFSTQSKNAESKIPITVYKSPSCGCCEGYATELRKNGFQVEVISIEDMNTIKEQYNIPRNMESCHTALVGDYFVEGHVPMETVQKMLEEQPSIDGISLPRMPSGSPGMPGIKNEVWKIYSLTNGEYSNYMDV